MGTNSGKCTAEDKGSSRMRTRLDGGVRGRQVISTYD